MPVDTLITSQTIYRQSRSGYFKCLGHQSLTTCFHPRFTGPLQGFFNSMLSSTLLTGEQKHWQSEVPGLCRNHCISATDHCAQYCCRNTPFGKDDFTFIKNFFTTCLTVILKILCHVSTPLIRSEHGQPIRYFLFLNSIQKTFFTSNT